MHKASSIQASSGLTNSGEIVSLDVDLATVETLNEAAQRAGETACAVIEVLAD